MLTTSQAVLLCEGKFTDRHIRRVCKAGRIKGAQLIGKTWIFTEKAFRSWLENDDLHRPSKQV